MVRGGCYWKSNIINGLFHYKFSVAYNILLAKIFQNKNKIQEKNIDLDMTNIPKHIGIIMDGNGRWAKAKKLPRSMGHKAGVETIRKILTYADPL